MRYPSRLLVTLGWFAIQLGCAQAKSIYLTFDDGPRNETAGILALLKELNVKATFFLTGSNAEAINGGIPKQKELFNQIVNDGHQVGNHCFVHRPMTKAEYKAAYGETAFLTDQQRKAFKANYADNELHFRELRGDKSFAFKIARLPGDGRFFPHLVNETTALGMKHYGWQFEIAPNGAFSHVSNDDWQSIAGVAATNEGLPGEGDIILLHDAHWGGGKNNGYAFLAPAP
jgi:peptidoglycan/xylan/chitin deacetylase (PgdA/CDA1 family)